MDVLRTVAHVLDLEDVLNATTDAPQKTPLIRAAENGYYECVEFLIGKGANVNKTDTFRHTPLMVTANNGRDKCAETLIKAGADVNVNNLRFHDTALIFAARSGHSKCVQLLLAAGADVNEKNRKYRTALMEAASGRHSSCILKLLEAGADVYKAYSYDCTPSMVASKTGNASMVDALIQKGDDVNAVHIDKYKEVRTALIYASQAGHTLCVELLLKAGTNMITEQTDEKYRIKPYGIECGPPPTLDYAFQNGNEERSSTLRTQ